MASDQTQVVHALARELRIFAAMPGFEPEDGEFLNQCADEIERLRDKARRFKGWRVRYQWRHLYEGTWHDDARDSWLDDARKRRDALRADKGFRNVRIVRVYRKAKP